MTDLAVLAIGFGLMAIAALLLYPYREWLIAHPETSWGVLAGVVAFLGLSHAMALVLVNHKLFADEAIATSVSVLGLVVGLLLGWWLLEKTSSRAETSRVLWAATVFVALHSLGDGIALGRDFVPGGFAPAVPADAVTISATVLHRFFEGALIVVPAIAANRRPVFAWGCLSAALISIPAAYVPGWVLDIYGLTPTRSLVITAIPTFFAASEAVLALVLLARVFLPAAAASQRPRWVLWAALGFVAISLVHFLVE